MKSNHRFCMQSARAPRAQRGVVLFIALIVLIAMTLAGIGMARSVDTLNIIANNIAFGQSNLMVGDWGAEQAYQWLNANKGNLDSDQPVNNYYASSNAGVNPASWLTPATWNIANPIPNAPPGYTVSTIIQRLCVEPGSKDLADGTQACIKTTSVSSQTATSSTSVDIGGTPTAVGGSVAAGSSAGGGASYDLPGNVYYRVTVRVEGPRNSVSVVQTLVAITT